MKIENWLGHKIRFVEIDGEWWSVAKDIANALGLKQVTRAISGLPKDGVTTSKVIDSLGRLQDVNVVNEKSIYRLIFKSRKKEAEAFQDWVFDVLKQLRQSAGLEGFQIFRMLDKEHQREAMSKLKQSLKEPKRVNFIKANTIANKAVSTKYGYSKSVKKDSMSPEMLIDRQPILDDTVDLMRLSEEFKLDISVSKTIYKKYIS
jgi:prophage antirepressor-like protein